MITGTTLRAASLIAVPLAARRGCGRKPAADLARTRPCLRPVEVADVKLTEFLESRHGAAGAGGDNLRGQGGAP